MQWSKCHGALIAVLSFGCSDEDSNESQPGGDLVSVLEADGFTVARGESAPFFIEDCASLPSCYGANATSPYALWNIPPAPGETRLDSGFDVPRTPPGMAPGWRLREDEAVVYVGRTPPPAAYFSYAPYVFARTNPTSGARATVFASFADSLNVANLRTAGESRFDAKTAIVLTADRALEAKLRQRLIESGVAETSINTLVVPASDLELGLDEQADELMMLQRFALFEDEQAGKSYLENLPATLLRVTPAEPRAIDPLPVPARAARATGSPEQELISGLDALEAAVRAAHSGTVEPVAIIPASLVIASLDPAKCLAGYTNCLGEVSDTTYSAGPLEVLRGNGTLTLSDDPNEFFIAMGVNHETAGKATYSNVVVQNHVKQAGVADLTSREMAGSAERFLPAHPDAAKLFAIKIARRCAAEPYCVELPTEFPGVGLDENLIFIFRAYLQPGHTVSSAPEELVTERVLHYLP